MPRKCPDETTTQEIVVKVDAEYMQEYRTLNPLPALEEAIEGPRGENDKTLSITQPIALESLPSSSKETYMHVKAKCAGTLDGRIQATNNPQDCDPTTAFLKQRRLDDAVKDTYTEAYLKAFYEQVQSK